MSLRFEADPNGSDHVTIALPAGSSAAGDMTRFRIRSRDDDDTSYIYGLQL